MDIFLSLLNDSVIKISILLHPPVLIAELKLLLLHLVVCVVRTLIVYAVTHHRVSRSFQRLCELSLTTHNLLADLLELCDELALLFLEISHLILVVALLVGRHCISARQSVKDIDRLLVLLYQVRYFVQLFCYFLSELLAVALGPDGSNHILQLAQTLSYLSKCCFDLRYLMPSCIFFH